MQFGRFLEALNAKGRVAAAEHYEKLVADRFKDTLSKEQIRLLEVDQIVTILHVADIVKEAQFKQPSPESWLSARPKVGQPFPTSS